jgi:hypothetical protein
VKVHPEGFKRKQSGYAGVNLGERDVDGTAVCEAFTRIGYCGSIAAELESCGENDLRDVSNRIDKLVLAREGDNPM